jgi:hypothetical protein
MRSIGLLTKKDSVVERLSSENLRWLRSASEPRHNRKRSPPDHGVVVARQDQTDIAAI